LCVACSVLFQGLPYNIVYITSTITLHIVINKNLEVWKFINNFIICSSIKRIDVIKTNPKLILIMS